MICGCNMLSDDYSIEFVQGDYMSAVFTITDEYDDKVDNIEHVVFTCERLGLQQNLTQLSDVEFMLVFSGEETDKFVTYNGTTYDITLQLKGSDTPLTLVHNASFSVLKKNNPLEGGDNDGGNDTENVQG